MANPPIKRHVLVVSACTSSDGSPDFALNEVEVDEDEYANGIHYDLADELLTAAGYEKPWLHFDDRECPDFLIPAVRQYLGIDTPASTPEGGSPVDPSLSNTIRTAGESVTRLVEVCRKNGPLYTQDRKATAQVSRTGKWLLNAIAALNTALATPCTVGRKRGR
jgi:hypothetical protein